MFFLLRKFAVIPRAFGVWEVTLCITNLNFVFILQAPNILYVVYTFQLGVKRIHTVRTMGGNKKYRALRQDHGNFAWGSEGEKYVKLILIVMLVEFCCAFCNC